jgi:hypothetical protein
MNPYAKLLTGGAALLATTALVSGSAFAASIVAGTDLSAGTTKPGKFTALTIPKNYVAGSTGSTTALGPMAITLSTSASTPYTQATSVLLNFTNAQVTGTPTLTVATVDSGSSLTNIGTGATATMFSDHILISTSTTGGTWSYLRVGNVSFNNAQALASVGSSISVSGSVTISGIGQTESLASTNLVTSVAGPVVTVTAKSTVQASNTSTPPFINFGSSTQLTAALGTISIANPTGFDNTLSVSATAANLVTTSVVQVTHPVLANAAVASARVNNTSHTTVAEFAGGSESFAIASGSINTTAPITIAVVFNGTTQITGGKGGTATVTFNGAAGGTNFGAIDPVTGNLADVTLNGLSADVNTAQSSANAFPSYIRIHNTGASAGVATIVVKNDATGATIGTYTTASIPGGATLQVGTGQIETALSITPSATSPYELLITGAFTGYVQHLGFDGKSLIDLDGFRAASNP